MAMYWPARARLFRWISFQRNKFVARMQRQIECHPTVCPNGVSMATTRREVPFLHLFEDTLMAKNQWDVTYVTLRKYEASTPQPPRYG